MRYGTGIFKCNKNELQQIDGQTRKVLTINKEIHPRSAFARIFASRKKAGRAWISCESRVCGEVNNLN